MSKEIQNAERHDDGSYVAKKSKKSSVLAFILCLLIAFVIWAYADATESENKIGDDSSVTTTSSEQIS